MYLRAHTILPQRVSNPQSPFPVLQESVNFVWKTAWETDATSGFIVQEMYTVFEAVGCGGQPEPQFSRYWEAWEITGPGTYQPNSVDYWTIVVGRGSGVWTKAGSAYLVRSLDPDAHFSPSAAPGAGVLLSTYTQPRNLGPVLLHRSVQGEWCGCGLVTQLYHRLRTTPRGGALLRR